MSAGRPRRLPSARGPPPPRRPAGFHAGPYLFGNIGIFEPSDYYEYYYDTYGLEDTPRVSAATSGSAPA